MRVLPILTRTKRNRSGFSPEAIFSLRPAQDFAILKLLVICLFTQQAHVGAHANEEVSLGILNRLPEFVADESCVAAQERVRREFFLLQDLL